MYSFLTMKYFLEPVNVGEVPGANSVGKAGDPEKGNFMKIWLKIDRKNVITDIGFKTVGCVPAIASGSVVTILAKGKSLEEALKIRLGNMISALGGLPGDKRHTARLGLNALKDAINKCGNIDSNKFIKNQ